MERLLILLSTYNGAQFIEEQINSILLQRDVEWSLLIRDDGSSDNTVDILKKFQKNAPEKIQIIEGANVGWKRSFMILAEYASKEYPSVQLFAFADQDDIWLPDKLSSAIKQLNTLSEGPRLYASNLNYYKDGIDLGVIRHSKPVPTWQNCLIRNYATGCTIVFNRELLSLLIKEYDTIDIPHDYWAYMIAVLCGNVVIDDHSYILYRQHSNNQVGAKSGMLEIWKRRLKSFLSTSDNNSKEQYARDLLRIHGDSMSPEVKRTVLKVASYRNSIFTTFALLIDNKYTYNKKSNDFWMKLRIIFHRL